MGGEESEVQHGETPDILNPFAQGGEPERDHVQAVIQILAEFPLLNALR